MTEHRKGRVWTSILLIGFTAHVVAAATGPGNVWTTLVAENADEPQRLALIDLQRYIGQATGTVPELRVLPAGEEHRSPAILVALASSSSIVGETGLEKELAGAGTDGYVLANRKIGDVPLVVVAANSSRGVVNGLYGLLHELGFGFYLGSEAVPAQLPEKLPRDLVVASPAFAVRGVLPWHNFFNSPTTWDPPDYRALVDQLVRMRANLVVFHTYDNEPFAAYERDGKMVDGHRLLTTADEVWGTKPVPTREFAAGTDKLYAQPYFGAATTELKISNDDTIRAEQRVMADALEYASRRGLQTAIGFSVIFDPTEQAEREAFTQRLTNLLKTYPTLDCVYLWQAETQGAQGFRTDYGPHWLAGSPAPNSRLHTLAAQRRGTFKRIVDWKVAEPSLFRDDESGKIARAMEGARLEQYALLAHEILQREAPHVRLVISGWGGDERLLAAEYFDGLDKVLPPDVVFSALDNIGIRPRIDRAYHELPPTRQRWPIPWLEADGDQWHPQPSVNILEKLMRDTHASGSQGILGIHWRTRDIEENFAYLMEYCWNPRLDGKTFFQDLARRCYATEIAAEMAQIHEHLDQLGYRWVGGNGQAECAPFTWGPGEQTRADQLAAVRARCIKLLPKAGHGRPRLEWLIHQMDWVLSYREAELAAVRVSELLSQAEKEPARAVELATEARGLLTSGALDRALQAYAQRLSTRGEYGVLATINCKAAVASRDLLARAEQLAGVDEPTTSPSAWKPDPAIVMPRLYTSAFANQPLEIMPLVLGGGQAYLHHRTIGSDRWQTVPVELTSDWVGRCVIAAEAVQHPGIEFGLSFANDPRLPMSFCPVGITVMPATNSSVGAPSND